MSVKVSSAHRGDVLIPRSKDRTTGHPLDGVLENLGWYGKRFRADRRADALLFGVGENRLLPIDPAPIPLGLAIRLHRLARTEAARNLFSHLARHLRAKGPVGDTVPQYDERGYGL